MAVTWTEYLRLRITHEEKGIPWWVNDKTKLNKFCVEHSIPAPRIFEVWEHPTEIDLNALPEVFVLKPNMMHSSNGVMILRKVSEGVFFDSFSGKTLTFDEIRKEQLRLFEKSKFQKSYRIFAEEIIFDAKDQGKIPYDYKIYCFYDKPVLIQQIDRNVQPTATYFFDGSFGELGIDGKISSDWKRYQFGEPAVPAASEEMLQIARRLMREIKTPFMRVDMYNSTRGPLLGELTPAPGGPYYGKLYAFTETYNAELGNEWSEAMARIERDNGDL